MIECDWRTSVDDERCVTAVPDCVVCVCVPLSANYRAIAAAPIIALN